MGGVIRPTRREFTGYFYQRVHFVDQGVSRRVGSIGGVAA
jgi:hypothetical protein